MTEADGMSQKCSICSSPLRDEINNLLLTSSVSNRRAATQFQLSEASVRRHLRAHLQPAARRTQPDENLMSPGAFGTRLLQIADGLRDTRELALRQKNPALAVKAAQAEATALNQLISRVGLRDQEALETLNDAEKLGRAIRSVALNSNPEIAQALHEYLIKEQASTDLVEAMKAIEQHARKREIES